MLNYEYIKDLITSDYGDPSVDICVVKEMLNDIECGEQCSALCCDTYTMPDRIKLMESFL